MRVRKVYVRNEAQREQNRLSMARRRAASPKLREYGRVTARAYAAEHREERSAYAKQYRLKRDYGMTWADFDAMLKAQNGKCAICTVLMTPPARATKNSVAVTVDHCHDTGKVRGLLCYSCNLALGIFKDCPDRLRAAVSYMESHALKAKGLTEGPIK